MRCLCIFCGKVCSQWNEPCTSEYGHEDSPDEDDAQFEDYLESGKAMTRELTTAEMQYIYLELK